MKSPAIDNKHLEEIIRGAIACLDGNAELTGVRIAPLNRAGLLSGSGEVSAAIELVYNGLPTAMPDRLWMKTAADPDEAFRVISSAYERLVAAGLQDTAPRPIAPDGVNGVVLTEYVAGKPLLTLAYAFCLRTIPNPKIEIERLFEKLGHWLASYHKSAYAGSETKLSDLFVQIDRDLSHIPRVSQQQLSILRAHLASARIRKCEDQQFPNVYSHADFSLRNVLVRPQNEFTVIDWDAPLERKFPDITLCWWDLYHMWMNINSLVRLWPIVSRRRIRLLAERLVCGYLDNSETALSYEDFTHSICYLLSLRFMAGSQSIRRIDLRYNNLLAQRFVRLFRNAILDGNADVVDWLQGN